VESRGEGLRVVSGAAANGAVVVARRGSGIRSLADLKGRRVATPQLGNTQDLSARHTMKHRLGQTDTHNVLAIPNAEQALLMARGEIDAAWVPEPWGQRLIQEAGAELVLEEKDLWPGGEFALTLVVTTPAFLTAHPDVVEGLLRVHDAWTKRLERDIDAQVPALADALFAINGKRLAPGVVEKALGRLKFTNDPLRPSLEAFAQWSEEETVVPRSQDLAGLVDSTLLRKVTAEPHAPGDGAEPGSPARSGAIEVMR
jgi:NitT/TauT family transport system substrate-binding protein